MARTYNNSDLVSFGNFLLAAHGVDAQVTAENIGKWEVGVSPVEQEAPAPQPEGGEVGEPEGDKNAADSGEIMEW